MVFFTHLTMQNTAKLSLFATLAFGLINTGAIAKSPSPAAVQTVANTSGSKVQNLPVITEAWVRATATGQAVTGAFMRVAAPADKGLRLVRASSPVAKRVELHEMKMEGEVMQMRELKEGLRIAAGEALELKPGGYHIMLMGLKKALPAESAVPLSLYFVDDKGKKMRVNVQAPALMSAPVQEPAAAAAQ